MEIFGEKLTLGRIQSKKSRFFTIEQQLQIFGKRTETILIKLRISHLVGKTF